MRTIDLELIRKYRRKARRTREDDVGSELNVVPYLDVVINLIMFLLVAQAALGSLAIVDVTAPSYTKIPSVAPAGITLTLGVARDGFYIAGKGAVLAGGKGPTIEKRANGSYDYPALTLQLRQIKTIYPEVTELFLTADKDVPYEVIVKTLDHSRADGRGPLFPEVAFSEIR